jgi:Mrp family chromosome partitioning ATPase
VKPLAEIAPRPEDELGRGALRSEDLEALSAISGAAGSGPLLVTGAGEGPLAVATGLAAASAASGTRTVLVECDFADPVLAVTLGLAPAPGLHEYQRVEAEAPQLLQSLVLAGPASGEATEPLVCIVAGEGTVEGPASPDSEHFRHAVSKLRSGYESVILLGPPLGDESGSLATIAAAADSVVTCVGPALLGGRSGRRLAKSLRRLPARNAGVVAYG